MPGCWEIQGGVFGSPSSYRAMKWGDAVKSRRGGIPSPVNYRQCMNLHISYHTRIGINASNPLLGAL